MGFARNNDSSPARRAAIYLGLVEPPGRGTRSTSARIFRPGADSSRRDLYLAILSAIIFAGLFVWGIATSDLPWKILEGLVLLAAPVPLFLRAVRQLNRLGR